MSNSLLKFIKRKKDSNSYYIPNYFYFNSNQKWARFLFDIKEDDVVIGELNWRQYKNKLIICCDKDTYNSSKLNTPNIDKYSNYLNIHDINQQHIPIIKSNLQKCIRRSLIQKSIISAMTLFCLNKNDLLRRLPIIMLEDTCINYHFINVVWYMCASSKGYIINDKILSYILGIIKYMASINQQEIMNNEHIDIINIKQLLKQQNNLSEIDKNLLLSLQLRKAYGGLQGDLKMLDYYTLKWYERLDNHLHDLDVNIELLELESIEYFSLNIIHPSAIDFHCTGILKQLMKKYNNIPEELLKNTIWHHRSKTNNKQITYGKDEYNNEYIDTWNTIKPYLHMLSLNYISYKFDLFQ